MQNIYSRGNKTNKLQENYKTNTQKSNVKNNIKIKNLTSNPIKTVKSVKTISKTIATTVKAIVTGTKALITAIVAMGWVIILIIVLLLSITAILYNTGENSDIVTVALSQVGNVGGKPYWSWYGFKERVEWCAIFVSFCAN